MDTRVPLLVHMSRGAPLLVQLSRGAPLPVHMSRGVALLVLHVAQVTTAHGPALTRTVA
jgi:hypothetical protein